MSLRFKRGQGGRLPPPDCCSWSFALRDTLFPASLLNSENRCPCPAQAAAALVHGCQQLHLA